MATTRNGSNKEFATKPQTEMTQTMAHFGDQFPFSNINISRYVAFLTPSVPFSVPGDWASQGAHA